MFLTNEELETLTGYKKPGWQTQWLKRHDWRFERSATGRIVVSRGYAEAKLRGEYATKPAVTLNFDALKRRA